MVLDKNRRSDLGSQRIIKTFWRFDVMQWHELFPKDKPPSEEDISAWLGTETAGIWKDLITTCQQRWKARSRLTYSVCSGKPGWNLKLQKSGKTLGTLYPEQGSFSVFVVVPFSAGPMMQELLPDLSTELADLYRNADDFMKAGKWMMFRITRRETMQDYLKILAVKLEH